MTCEALLSFSPGNGSCEPLPRSVPRRGASLAADDVIDHCRNQIAGYKCPRSVDFRDTPLPLSGAGKVLKRELREPYWKNFTEAVN